MPAYPKPVLLLPLRMEIRVIEQLAVHGLVGKKMVKFVYEPSSVKGILTIPKTVGHPQLPVNREIWIRWYPDECQVFPRVGRITEQETEAFQLYLNADNRDPAINWKDFVKAVGIQRARFILDNAGTDPDFDHENDNSLDQPDKSDGMQQFLTRGAKLKALPNKVVLYTIHENSSAKQREVKLLAEGKDIDSNLVISAIELVQARWAVDFDEAVVQGMGIKITDEKKCQQVEDADWLIAVGHKEEANNLLNELLLRHKALGRFGILAQDTPSNNTEEVKSVFTENESGTPSEKNISFGTEASGYTTNEDLLVSALGVGKQVFKGVDNAGGIGVEVGRIMRGLLFDSCTITFRHERSLLKKLNLTANNWALLRDHYIDHVYGGGVFPAIQIGRNPYGILPVTNLENFTSSAAQENTSPAPGVKTGCEILKTMFLQMAKFTPVIGRDTDVENEDAYEKLVQILQLNPVSERMEVQNFGQILDFNIDPQILDCPMVAQRDPNDPLYDPLQYTLKYLKQVKGYLESPPSPVFIKPITVDIKIPGRFGRFDTPKKKPGDKIGERVIKKEYFGLSAAQLKNMPLLERMLRYYAYYASTQELTDKQETVNHLLKSISSAVILIESGKVSLNELDSAMLDSIDCLSYRLDAWITSLATLRLDELNNPREIAVTIDLSFDPKILKTLQNISRMPEMKNKIKVDTVKGQLTLTGSIDNKLRDLLITVLPQKYHKEIEDLFTSKKFDNSKGIGAYGWLQKPYSGIEKKSDGYLQAPSIAQATTGAILRSAARSSEGGVFQIELSSDRVRQAMWFNQGVQRGYSPAELLGYQIERNLHEKKMDEYILQLREKCPLSVQVSSGHDDTIKDSYVINGEKFVELEEQKILTIVNEDGQKLRDLQDIQKLVHQLQDAVADLYTAETVYQVVQGNTARTAAWLETVEGKNIPPTPEVAKTSRTGNHMIQRILYPVALDNPDFTSPRTLAEPFLKNLCESFLKGFDQISFSVDFLPWNAENPIHTFNIKPVDDLKVYPADLVVDGREGLEKSANIYIWSQILQNQGLQDVIGPDFSVNPSPDTLNKAVSVIYRYDSGVENYMNKAALLHLFLNSVQPLKPEDIGLDLSCKQIVTAKTLGCIVLQNRADDIIKSLKIILQELNGTPTTDRLLAIVLKLAKYNLSIPATFDSSLSEQLKQDITAFTNKQELYRTVTLSIEGTQKSVHIDPHRTCLVDENDIVISDTDEAILLASINKLTDQSVQFLRDLTGGTALPVFPPFQMDVDLEYKSQNKVDIGNTTSDFHVYGKVRKNIGMLLELNEQGMLNSKPLYVHSRYGTQISKNEAIAQAIQSGSLSSDLDYSAVFDGDWSNSNIDMHYIVSEEGLTLTQGENYAGLKIDEWTEFFPNSSETTGLAFHYDNPQTEAPNAILLAVPPIMEKFQWSEDELSKIIADTIDLLRIRSVSSETIAGSDLGNFLPLMWFGTTPAQQSLLPGSKKITRDQVSDRYFTYEPRTP